MYGENSSSFFSHSFFPAHQKMYVKVTKSVIYGCFEFDRPLGLFFIYFIVKLLTE